MIAYLGRYGHQPVNVLLAMRMTDVRKLYEAVSKLITRENAAASR